MLVTFHNNLRLFNGLNKTNSCFFYNIKVKLLRARNNLSMKLKQKKNCCSTTHSLTIHFVSIKSSLYQHTLNDNSNTSNPATDYQQDDKRQSF